MYVNHVRIYGVKVLRHNFPEEGDLPEPARQRVLLHGANGSGKTTVLDGLFTLWRLFGEWIDAGAGGRIDPSWTRNPFAHGEMTAVEMCGFSKGLESLWIGIGKGNAWEDLKKEHPQSQFAGMITYGTPARGEAKFILELPKLDLGEMRAQILVGKINKPNVVYIPPEERLLPARSQRPKLVNLQEYLWSAEFSPEIDLDGLLITIKAHEPARYERTLELVNGLLRNQRKSLVAAAPGTRHEVEIETEMGPLRPHPLDLLSSGEKQIVLLVAFASCLLQEGGILIADEPDLHIHAAMVKPLVGVLYQLTEERHGQLIVAAHSTQLRNWFASPTEQLQLSPWLGGSQP